jgi:hypothetical protein
LKRRERTVDEKQAESRESFIVPSAEVFRSCILNGYVINYPSFAAGWTEDVYQYLTTMKETGTARFID